MFGILSIILNDEVRVAHPIFEKDADPQVAGAFILQWLKQQNPETLVESLSKGVQNVTTISDMKQVERLVKDGSILYTGAGVYLLPILSSLNAPALLADASAAAKEDPEHCIVYELDLDAGSFATYYGAVQRSIPAGTFVARGVIRGSGEQKEKRLIAAANFRLTNLPEVEKYLSFWRLKAHNLEEVSK